MFVVSLFSFRNSTVLFLDRQYHPIFTCVFLMDDIEYHFSVFGDHFFLSYMFGVFLLQIANIILNLLKFFLWMISSIIFYFLAIIFRFVILSRTILLVVCPAKLTDIHCSLFLKLPAHFILTASPFLWCTSFLSILYKFWNHYSISFHDAQFFNYLRYPLHFLS